MTVRSGLTGQATYSSEQRDEQDALIKEHGK